MAFNRLFHWAVASIAFFALGPTANAVAQQPSDEELAGPKISIVIEEGERAPPEVLDAIAAREIAPGSGSVSFSVAEGRGVLAAPNQVVNAASGGAIAHGEIIAGPNYDETIVRMLVDGKPAGRPLRVGTIATGSLGKLLSKDVPDGSEALLSRGADYAVVDMDVLRAKAPVDSSNQPTGQYCAAILDKERDIYGDSRVLARACSDSSEEGAFADAQSKASAAGANVQYAVWIMTLYQHAGYGGRSYKAYGCCGDCDWAGYSFDTVTLEFWFNWPHNMSSAGRAYGLCNRARYARYYGDPWGGERSLPDWYVGDFYNDNIGRVHVYR